MNSFSDAFGNWRSSSVQVSSWKEGEGEEKVSRLLFSREPVSKPRWFHTNLTGREEEVDVDPDGELLLGRQV